MERFDPRLFIFGAVLVTITGFLLLDTDELLPGAGIIEIIGGKLLVGGISYRFVLLLSVLAVAVGAYRSARRGCLI